MTMCARCVHADALGWWGPPSGLTHCRRCHRDWPIGSPAGSLCHLCAHFSTPGACDVHLTAVAWGPPAEWCTKNVEARLVLGQDKYGPIWRVTSRTRGALA